MEIGYLYANFVEGSILEGIVLLLWTSSSSTTNP